MTRTPTKQPDLSREFERQAEIIGLADELAAMVPPVCETCGQTIEATQTTKPLRRARSHEAVHTDWKGTRR